MNRLLEREEVGAYFHLDGFARGHTRFQTKYAALKELQFAWHQSPFSSAWSPYHTELHCYAVSRVCGNRFSMQSPRRRLAK